MRIFPRPRSMLGVILVGFAVVALPLIAALILALVNAERLERQSTVLVEQAVQVARFSEALTEQLTDMERNARQYQVLGDEDLLEVYRQRQARFRETLDELAALPLPPEGNQRIRALRRGSRVIGRALIQYEPQSPELAAALDGFDRLEELAKQLNVAGATFVDQEMATLSRTATESRQHLLLVSMLVIPAVLILSLIFVFLINRPVRQLESAIGRLGEQGFDTPIAVGGPPEIRALGAQLDDLRRRLDALESEKSRFLRHMSHELKTPLASVREGAELLLDGATGELTETQYEVAALLRANSLELQQMILNLLDFSAWQDRSHRLTTTRLDLKALARSLADRHRLSLAGRDISLEVSGEGVQVMADRDKLRTALDNLVSNAVKYSPEHGVIRLQVGKDDSRAILDVIDQGPGIPQTERQRIFEPFYQSETPHAGAVRGTGIGLSVVRECINAHGGDIEVRDSQHGTHIRVTLPWLAG